MLLPGHIHFLDQDATAKIDFPVGEDPAIGVKTVVLTPQLDLYFPWVRSHLRVLGEIVIVQLAPPKPVPLLSPTNNCRPSR